MFRFTSRLLDTLVYAKAHLLAPTPVHQGEPGVEVGKM